MDVIYLFFVLLGIFGLISVIGTLCTINKVANTDISSFFMFFNLAVFIFSIGGFVTLKSIPSAMDVYQGKTELRKTFDGNTPVDSVVIFKTDLEK